MRSLWELPATGQDTADHVGDHTGVPSAGPSQEHLCLIPHLDDVISAILAVDGLDSADVQAAEHF